MTAALTPAVVLLIFALFIHTVIGAAAVSILFGLVTARRHRLEMTEEDAVVRSFRPARVPWSSVTAVRSGGWRGGILLTTATWQEIWSPAPCSWWAGPAPAEQLAEVERWWVDHRGPAWTPAKVAPVPATIRPPVRYRTSTVAASVAVLGALMAIVNAAALWWPLGGFTVIAVEVTEPSVDHVGWSIVAAFAAGAVLGAWWTVKAHRLLSRGALPESAANARPGNGAKPLLVVAAAAGAAALTAWLGVAPAIDALGMVGFGVAAVVAGSPMAVAARRFEERTGRLLLSTNPLSRGRGLETGPPR
jgi:hypothetical protein